MDGKTMKGITKAPGSCLAASPDAHAQTTTIERIEDIISIHWYAPTVKGGNDHDC